MKVRKRMKHSSRRKRVNKGQDCREGGKEGKIIEERKKERRRKNDSRKKEGEKKQ